MRNKVRESIGIWGAAALYVSSLFSGCASNQSIIRTHAPETVRPQITAPAPKPRYNFETAPSYGHMNLSSTESVNGRSTSIDVELYDTDGNRRTVEQAIVTRREGYKSESVMFVRPSSKVAKQPMSNDDVRIMTPENEQMFDRMYGGSDE